MCVSPSHLRAGQWTVTFFFFYSGKTGIQDYMYFRDFFIMVFSVVNPCLVHNRFSVIAELNQVFKV